MTLLGDARFLIREVVEGEGDHDEWAYERNPKYKCIIDRHPTMGHWCGYVAIPRGHPCFGRHYDEIYKKWPDLRVHGGITYSEPYNNPQPISIFDGTRAKIRKVREAAKHAEYWEIGFDCGHVTDLIPFLSRQPITLIQQALTHHFERVAPEGKTTYKNKIWVWNEVHKLAFQLDEIEKKEKRKIRARRNSKK